MHDSFTGFLVGRGPRNGNAAHGRFLRRIRRASSASDLDRSSPPGAARRFASSLSNPPQGELSSEQWCLFAPVQPGNEIKFAMFRKTSVQNAAAAARNLVEHAG